LEQNDNYKGYSLFSTTEDFQLKSRNRGVVMANIVEEHYNKAANKVSSLGLSLILGYFQAILPVERRAAKDALELILKARGIKYAR
jgi:hypothetical protein